ncbi:MAG: ABC transporter substrate-binding protein [Gammaproteobacteria bacterium]|nr:MAG: ABC transporter substrate-binding protein [Gammaproteobacteria bacterium]
MKPCRLLAAVVLSTVVLLGCQPNSNTLRTKTLVYCFEGSPATLNPQQATGSLSFDATVDIIYETLISYDQTSGRFRPKLATHWSISPDQKHYTFHLRKNVQFHHGWGFQPSRSLNAQDVVFSFQRQLDSQHPFHNVGSADYPYFHTNRLHQVLKDIVQIDPYTVEFVLEKPLPNFLTLLSMDFAIIQSAEYADFRMRNRRLFDDQPIGTGPFRMTSHKSGFYLRYQRFERYWGDPPYFQKLVFAVSPSPAVRLGRLMTGECDLMSQPQPRQLLTLKKTPQIKVSEFSDNSISYWAFNVLKPRFSDPRIRKALAMAVDRQRLVDIVYNGTGQVARGLLPENFFGFAPVVDITLDPVGAKTLLRASGWDFSREFEIVVPDVQRSYNPNPLQTAQLIRYDLSKIGVKAKIKALPWTALLRHLNLGQYDTVIMGWRADNMDPVDFLYPIASCDGRTSGTNRALWCHPDFDRLLIKARQTTVHEERQRYLVEAQRLFVQDLPWYPLVSANRYVAHQASIKGIRHSASGRILFKKITRTRKKP